MTSAPSQVFDLVEAQYEALAEALAIDPERASAVREFLHALRARCVDASLFRPPRWSGMGDDCSPFEWSVAFRRGAPDLRLLLEAQADPPSAISYWSSSRELTSWLVEQADLDCTRLERLLDLFEPSDPSAFFAALHGIEWRGGETGLPRVKIYVNPAARSASAATIQEVLNRLGLADSWLVVERHLDRASIAMLSLDLDSSEHARVKVYLRAREVAALANIYAEGDGLDGAEVGEVVSTLVDPAGPASRELEKHGRLPRPGWVVLHFTASSAARPARTVLQLHLSSLCEGDLRIRERVTRLLHDHGLEPDQYVAAMQGLARVSYLGPLSARTLGGDPLAGQVGLHNFVSLQREPEGSRVTIYVGLRAFAARFGWWGRDLEHCWPSPVGT